MPAIDNKKVVVISDIHLGDQRSIEKKYGWFVGENKARLLGFLDYVIAKKDEIGQLVFNGDVFDEWVAPMGAATFVDETGKETSSESAFFKAILKANKEIIDKLKQVKAAGVALVYVPGNHDMLITGSDLNTSLTDLFYQARDADGLGTYRPLSMPEVAIEHGHRYDFFNAPDPLSAKGTILPPGFFVTKYANSVDNNLSDASFDSLDQFDLDAYLANLTPEQLAQLPSYDKLSGFIDEIKKYYQYWLDIANGKYPEDADYYNNITYKAAWAGIIYQKFSLQYLLWYTDIYCNVAPYAKNYDFAWDVLPYLGSTKLYTEAHKSTIWAERCKINQATPHVLFPLAIAAGGINAVAHQMSYKQYFLNNTTNTRIVVFGHTHEVMIQAFKDNQHRDCIYANSGTWIDQAAAGAAKTCTFVELEKKNETYTVGIKQFIAANQIVDLGTKSFTL